MRWGRSYGGVSRGVVEAPDGEMSLLPAGLCPDSAGL